MEDVRAAFVGSDLYRPMPAPVHPSLYPLDLEFTLTDRHKYYAPLDERGIPQRRYETVGVQYNPTRIAAFGLAHWNRFSVAGNDADRETFLRAANWFMESDDARWCYHFDWGELQAPWISCMAQGEGISILTRAYTLTGDARFVEQALRAAEPFAIAVHDGGVRSRIDGRWEFLEEYPVAQPAHTLNGFLYALVGICELERVSPGAAAGAGLEPLVATLASQWHRWDLGYWSAYDLHLARGASRNAATVAYHNIHISLLSHLAVQFASPELKACAAAWDGYTRSLPNRIRALASKIRYRVYSPASR